MYAIVRSKELIVLNIFFQHNCCSIIIGCKNSTLKSYNPYWDYEVINVNQEKLSKNINHERG